LQRVGALDHRAVFSGGIPEATKELAGLKRLLHAGEIIASDIRANGLGEGMSSLDETGIWGGGSRRE
jgi:hypothetical protein